MNQSSDNTKNTNDTEKLDLFARFMTRLSNISLSKSFVGGLIFLGIIATFFMFIKGTEICLWSDCSIVNTVSNTGEFWSYAGGAATLMVLTTLVGMELLPAAAISIGVWLLMQRFH
jgi:hypothetical protein